MAIHKLLDTQKICDEYQAGAGKITTRQLAKKYGCSHVAIIYHLNKPKRVIKASQK